MSRILFVDDDPNVLQGLQRMLRDMRAQWEMEFAPGGEEALAVLARAPFDVVVTDMRMPGMDGAQLLTEVMQRHPDMVRIALSGQAEDEAVIRTVGAVHQYLSKPCDAETLKRTVARAVELRSLLANGDLKHVVSQMKSLPSVPALYTRLLEECRAAGGSLKAVGEIIAKDVGMTAKILHLANSSFFAIRSQVTDPVHAVQLLGLDTVKGLVLSAEVFSRFEAARAGRFPLDAVWRRSLTTSGFARAIARLEVAPASVVNDAAVAGLLHDAGQLVLATNFPERYDEVLALAAGGRAFVEAELAVFGATHAMVGAYLLGLWGIPDSIVEAVALHHTPRAASSREFSALTAVHVADAIADDLCAGPGGAASAPVDEGYLTALGLGARLATWRAACEACAGDTRDDE